MSKIKKKYLSNPDLASRYDFELKKCVHVRLYKRTKNELDTMKRRLDLPLQEIFECLSNAIIDEDPHIIAMLNEYRMKKDKKETESFSRTDTTSLLEVIAREDILFGDDK